MSLAHEDLRRKAKAELAARLAEELIRRRNTPEFIAGVERKILAGLHGKQREVVQKIADGLRFIAACCSRRAGKTHLAAALIVLKLLRAKYGQEVVFCAPTLARGKELIWAEVLRMIETYSLGWKAVGNTGRIYTTAGALFRIVGLDNKRQIGKISRGGNTILFVTDETQEYPHLLEQLMVGAGPALAQSRGAFLALGTPSGNDADYWSQICDGAEGFAPIHWWMGDNPYLGRDVEELIAEELTRHGWTREHPTFVREYLGRRCKDPSNLVLEFDKLKNVVSEVPGYNPDAYLGQPLLGYDYGAWRHFIGIDFGLKDATAWVVLAAPRDGRDVYVVHCEQETGLTWDQVADRTKVICDRFRPQGIVGDSASGGAQFILGFNQRYGSTVGVFARPATKHDKPASIALWNTELRTGRMRYLSPATDQLVEEATALQWGNPERTEILEGATYPEDLFDANRYAFNDFHAWAHAKPTVVKSDDQIARERRLERARNENKMAQMRRRA